jgi:8-oxo-dGTP pyrophosphatase MutT (NUDIX family)
MPIPPFDPRQVPVDAIDAHLPVVESTELQADALIRRFARQLSWQAELPGDLSAASSKVLRQAAVLVPIVVGANPAILLTQRTTHMSSHAGQIAFPGGRIDPQDRDAADAAQREAWEEVGLERRFITVLGSLPVYATGSGYSVTPVVALVQGGFSLRPNSQEVAEVFEVPLEFLMNPANHHRHAVEWKGIKREWFSMPYEKETHQRLIWGATAGILKHLYQFLQVGK